ncbi:hypothetical protein [Prauserella cavernicola]|uniref:Uncharacterized protein n=1 Tax=Prauserella cavernicola TaxID=2800127 RepID=A0A934QSX0_9PSEU|nr:hypothetical protein [Prauserella cavernicola]MBK1784793.1 hypothetical protein [Prauserella cavernicola]
MDERELEELFRDAPGEAPPPTFAAADIASESRRITRRRHSMIAGVACAVVLLGGAAGAVGVLLGGGDESTSTASGSAPNEGKPLIAGQPGASSGRLPSAQDFPDTVPKQGGSVEGESTLGCDKVDRELATALAGELPVGAGADAIGGLVCPAGSRTAAYTLDGGTVTAALVPEGVSTRLADRPEGTEVVERPAASGGTLLMVSIPDSATPRAPLANQLGGVADALAPRF